MKLHPKLTKPYLTGIQGYKGGAARQSGKNQKVYKLSSNENPVGPSPKAMEAMKAASADLHIYPDNTPDRLYHALSEFYRVLSPDAFVAGNSGSEMIELLMTAFVNPGDEVIVSNPCFLPYQMFSEWRGAKTVDVSLTLPDFSLDVAGILDAINDNTKLIFITTPNNPTGTYIPKLTMDALMQQVPDHVIVVVDEVYYRFADAADYCTALPYVQSGHNVIGVNSFSKSYGLAGLRLGYMYTRPDISAYIRGVIRPFIINSPGLAAAIGALQDDVWVEEVATLVRSQKRRVYKALDDLDIHYWKSQANFILVEPDMGEIPFVHALMDQGIMARSVASFGAPGCVRISIGDEEATDALIDALRVIYATV